MRGPGKRWEGGLWPRGLVRRASVFLPGSAGQVFYLLFLVREILWKQM